MGAFTLSHVARIVGFAHDKTLCAHLSAANFFGETNRVLTISTGPDPEDALWPVRQSGEHAFCASQL